MSSDLPAEWIADGYLEWPNSKFDGPALYPNHERAYFAAFRIEHKFDFYETLIWKPTWARKYRIAYRKREAS